MAASVHHQRVAVIAFLVLTLAGCSDDAGPTQWIPHNGTISGVITVTPTFSVTPVAAPSTAARSHAGGRALALRSPSSAPAFAQQMPARPLRPRLGPTWRAEFTPNDLIVTFRHTALGAPPVGSRALATGAGIRAFDGLIRSRLVAVGPLGARVTGVSPAILTAKLYVADTTQRDAIADALRRNPAVAEVARNRFIWSDETGRRHRTARTAVAVPPTTPTDFLYPFQSWHYGLIDLPRAWSITNGSASVLVAVVDDGIRFDHPAVAGNLTNDGYDFVSETDSLPLCTPADTISIAGDGDGPDPDPTIPASYSPGTSGTCFEPDEFGAHGLHVAGTIGAVGNDGFGVTGVNWTVRVRPVRVLGVAGFGSSYDVAQGILYAAGLPADSGGGVMVQASTGAKIINLSLGGSGDDPAMRNAIISAANAGALIVAAAGNASSSAAHYPAAYPQVLAVAAVGPDGAPAGYSNFGLYVALRAPGGNFAFGDAPDRPFVPTDGVFSTFWAFSDTTPLYGWSEGTSMAAPHVSGVAALILAQNPSLTAAAVRSRLTSYALGPASPYGAGLVNAYNSLTQSGGPATQRFARLYSATTGAVVQTVPAQAGGAFTFPQVEDGAYFVYGGTDESGDKQLGTPGRLWGAFGDLAAPGAVTVLGAQPVHVSLSIGLPIEQEPNDIVGTANALMIGGYVHGAIMDSLTRDVYRVRIPASATYTFETSGWVGACGFALEAATRIRLFDAAGTPVDSAGFRDGPTFNFCSRLTRSLSPGTYHVAVARSFPVRPFGGGLFAGRYRLQARVGT